MYTDNTTTFTIDQSTEFIEKLFSTENVLQKTTKGPSFHYLVYKWFRTVGAPTLGFFGFITNMLGAIIIRKSGLDKPSNCLLFGLSISDTFYCFSHINVFWALRFFPKTFPEGFYRYEMPYRWAQFCFVGYRVMTFIMWISGRTTNAITVLITIERLVAIFLPLRFKTIVTTKRVWVAMGASVIFWLPWVITISLEHKLHYYYSRTYKVYAGQLKLNTAYIKNRGLLLYIKRLWMGQINHTIPGLFVLVSCVCIGIKVVHTNRARARMREDGSKVRSTSQTTKTLVAVCVVYCVAKFSYLVLQVTIHINDNVTSVSTFVRNSVSVFGNGMLSINSASNFLIYIAFNKRFRDIFKSMIWMNKK